MGADSKNQRENMCCQHKKYDIIFVITPETLYFTMFRGLFVSNLLLVQSELYYFNRFTVSLNWSTVL